MARNCLSANGVRRQEKRSLEHRSLSPTTVQRYTCIRIKPQCSPSRPQIHTESQLQNRQILAPLRAKGVVTGDNSQFTQVPSVEAMMSEIAILQHWQTSVSSRRIRFLQKRALTLTSL